MTDNNDNNETRSADRLFLADGRPVKGLWLCPAQAHAYHDPEVAKACDCAEPRACKCGRAERQRWSDVCHHCRHDLYEERERAKWEQAPKVPPDYDGPVFDDEDDDGRGFHRSIRDLVDDHESREIYTTRRVYAARPQHMQLYADAIVEYALEDFHEDASDEVSGEAIAELQGFLDAWCEKHRVTTWFPDYERAVVYTPPSPPKDDEP